jgi:phosphohistidine phosphatase
MPKTDKPKGQSMDLVLWRHAEAEEGVPDETRALTRRGRKQAKKMARWLRKRLPADVRILVSPATRAQQTAEALGLPFDTAKHIGTAATAVQVLKAAGWPKAGGTVLVVGHQPTLGRGAARLMTGTEADWAIGKGAVWWLTQGAGGTGPAPRSRLHAVAGPDLS